MAFFFRKLLIPYEIFWSDPELILKGRWAILRP